MPTFPITIHTPTPYSMPDGTPPLLPLALTKHDLFKLSHVTELLRVTVLVPNAPRSIKEAGMTPPLMLEEKEGCYSLP